MPSASATRQACWPAAPPKQHSTWPVTSWPRWVEMRLMARAIASHATRMKSSASCSGAGGSTPAARMLAATAASARRAASSSSGASPSGPNTRGKNAARSLPATRLQSVTVSGPPLP